MDRRPEPEVLLPPRLLERLLRSTLFGPMAAARSGVLAEPCKTILPVKAAAAPRGMGGNPPTAVRSKELEAVLAPMGRRRGSGGIPPTAVRSIGIPLIVFSPKELAAVLAPIHPDGLATLLWKVDFPAATLHVWCRTCQVRLWKSLDVVLRYAWLARGQGSLNGEKGWSRCSRSMTVRQ